MPPFRSAARREMAKRRSFTTAGTGELSVDAPAGQELTSINVTSAGGRFIGNRPTALDGAFDNFAVDNVFKATFGGSFGSISFGNVLPIGIAESDVVADLFRSRLARRRG